MTQEEKQLLMRDLCARLPYGVICQLSNKDADVSIIEKLELGGLEHFIVGSMCVKPYLRSMSSMTDEECEEVGKHITIYDTVDWMNKHHFDYHGLIESGLALEAPEGMYKTK